MNRPTLLTREFIVKRLLDNHGFEEMDNNDVEAEWAPDWEAVRLTVKSTGHLFLWWPVSYEVRVMSEDNAKRCLYSMPQPEHCRQWRPS